MRLFDQERGKYRFRKNSEESSFIELKTHVNQIKYYKRKICAVLPGETQRI